MITNQRETKQKKQILAFLKENSRVHFTCDTVYDGLRLANIKVAKSTVYRYLALLESEGKLNKFVLNDSAPMCYQFVGEGCCSEHCHLVCDECGDIVHFEDDALLLSLDKLSQKNSIQINGSRTVFRGLCSVCIEK